jgi:GDP-L-fucose synthase|tara:strand:+ start:1170 stop:2126 length:957 start_codon:yes stop_codon:yes gene_type:complete
MYQGKKVLVAGGTGLIGSHVVEQLLENGANVRITEHIRKTFFDDSVEVLNGDLTNYDFCKKAVKGMDYVINCAALSGGLGKHLGNPMSTFFPNLIMNTNLLEAAFNENIEKYEYTSNNSVYPTSEYSMTEDRGTEGEPFPLGFAGIKRMGELQARFYHENSDMKIAITRGGNAYGEHDKYGLDTSHAVPALIRKAVEKQKPLVVWGDGSQVRDYTHAEDIARGILLTFEKHAVADPINLGTGIGTSTKDLIYLICEIAGYDNPEIIFDTTKFGGQKTKLVELTKCEQIIGFKAKYTLKEGLEKAIDWYKQNVHNKNYV